MCAAKGKARGRTEVSGPPGSALLRGVGVTSPSGTWGAIAHWSLAAHPIRAFLPPARRGNLGKHAHGLAGPQLLLGFWLSGGSPPSPPGPGLASVGLAGRGLTWGMGRGCQLPLPLCFFSGFSGPGGNFLGHYSRLRVANNQDSAACPIVSASHFPSMSRALGTLGSRPRRAREPRGKELFS